jgi:adenine/guanine/hypoxanthine permease
VSNHSETGTRAGTSAPTRRGVDGYFKITERGSTVGREVRGGVVTFLTMAYIIVLNPIILLQGKDMDGASLGGGNFAAIAAATALAAGVLTILMGVVANYPLALATGLGLNAFVTFSIASQMTWADAMGLVVLEGLVILVLVLTGFREAVFRAVPAQLKIAISVGIGLFIAFIGFVDAGFVTSTGQSSPPVGLGIQGSIATVPTLVFVITLLLTGILVARKVRGAILIGLLSGTVLALIAEAIWHLGSKVDDEGGWGLSVPALPEQWVSLPDLSLVGQVSFGSFERIGVLAALMLVFTLVFTNFFDAMGTLTGLSKEAGLADERGDFPRLRSALIVEGVGAVAGGFTSSSSNTVFIESGAGIGEGARTGLANLVTGALFLLAMFFTPLTSIVPSEVAAAALVIVGALMMAQIRGIDLSDFSVLLPVFLTITVMPLTYSIANGIGAGFISWVIIRSCSGRAREISPLLWVVAAGFLVYFVRGPIETLLGG